MTSHAPSRSCREMMWAMRGVVVVLGLAGSACGFSAAPGTALATDASIDAFVEPVPLDGPRADWWDASYPFRRSISIDTTKLAGPLADFPVLVRLPPDSTLADLRLVDSDNATLVSFELDTQTAAETTLWVKLSLDPASMTKQLWLYSGNEAAAARSSGPSVFGAYASVNHLGDAVTDSSGHLHATTLPTAAAQAPGVRASPLGQSRFFDGDDYMILADSAGMNLGQVMAATAWIKVAQYTSGYQCVVCKADEAWRLHRSNNGNGVGFGTSSGGSQDLNGNISVNDGAWHHAAIVMDGTKKHLYVDGVEDASVGYTKTLDNSMKLVRLGMNETFNGRYWNGDIDEIRIIDVARSAVWIAAEVLAVKDPAFVTLGPPETY